MMNVEALWLRRIGDKVQVLLESKPGEWRLVIEENGDGPISFSHIAEHPALQAAPADPLMTRSDFLARKYQKMPW